MTMWKISYTIQGNFSEFPWTVAGVPGETPEEADRYARRLMRRNFGKHCRTRRGRTVRDRQAEERAAGNVKPVKQWRRGR